ETEATSVTVYARAKDANGAVSTCLSSAGTWNNVAPTITPVSATISECSPISLVGNATDPGGPAIATSSYVWYNNNTCTTHLYTGQTYSPTSNIVSTNTYYYKAFDAQGLWGACTISTGIWTNIPLTANSFTYGTDISSGAKTFSWRALSAAAAGSCETITATLQTDGLKGFCGISATDITYTPKPNQTGTDSCTITITDGESPRDRTVTVNNIETTVPVITITNPNTSRATGKIITAITDHGTLFMTTGSTDPTCNATRNFITYSSTLFTSESDNGKYVCYKAVDSVGNTNYSGSNAIAGIDTTAPTPNMIAEPAYTSGVSNTISSTTVTDGGVGGVQYEFCINTGNNTTSCLTTGLTINNRINFTGLVNSQVYYYFVRSKDGLGNNSSWSTSTSSIQDSESPSTSMISTAAGNRQNGDFSITFTDTDNGALSSCFYKTLDTGAVGGNIQRVRSCNQTGTIAQSTLCPTNAEDSCIVQGYSIDAAGNVSNMVTKNFFIDTTPPSAIFTGMTPSNVIFTGDTLQTEVLITENNLINADWIWSGTTYNILDTGLLSLYNFDNNAALGENSSIVKDASMYKNTGTVVGATITSNGKYGTAYNFDGINDYIQTNNNLFISGDQTYAVRVKPAIIDGGLKGILTTHNYSITSNLGINMVGDKATISIGYTDGTREYSTKQSNYSIPANIWTNIVLSYVNQTNSINLYINGNLDSSWNLNKTVKFTPEKVLVGQRSNSYIGNYVFSGIIDEFRIYNRALSTGEVAMLYQTNLTKILPHKRIFTNTVNQLEEGPKTFGFNLGDVVNYTNTGSRYIEKWTYVYGDGTGQVAPTPVSDGGLLDTTYKKAWISGDTSGEILIMSGMTTIQSSGASWDGSLLGPSLIPAESPQAAQIGTGGISQFTTVYKTVEVGSTGTSLIASGGNFNLSVKVADVNSGTEIAVYRSSDNGASWDLNSPQTTCIIDADLLCNFESDHLSSFTFLGSLSTFYIENDAIYINTGRVTLNNYAPKAKQMRFSNNGSTRSGLVTYATTYQRNMFTLATNSGYQPRTVYARFYSGLIYSGTSDTIIGDTISPTVTTPVLVGGTYSGIYYSSSHGNIWAASRIADTTAINTGSCGLYYQSAGYNTINYVYTGGLHYCYTTGAGPVTFNSLYSFAINIQAVDKAGSATISSTGTFYRDDTGPVCTIFVNSGATYTSTGLVDLYVYCTDYYTTQFLDQIGGVGSFRIGYGEDSGKLSYTDDYYPVGEGHLYLVTGFQLSDGIGLKTVYIQGDDYLGNDGAISSDDITVVDPTVVYTGYISSGTTGNNGLTLYYKGTIDIRANVDHIGTGTRTCEYKTGGSSWAVATYSGTSSSGYCYKTGLSYTSDINIIFRAGLISQIPTVGITGAYIYDATPPTGGSFYINSNATYTNSTGVTLTSIDCGSDGGVGGIQMAFGNSTNPGSNRQSCSSSISHTLSVGDATKTVYMRFRDALGNITTSDVTDNIILDTTPAQVFTAVIYAGITGNNGSTLYYRGTGNIWSPVSDTVGVSGSTCEYTTGSLRAPAIYSGSATVGYCLKTGLSYTSNITINFRVRDVANNLSTGISSTYIYDVTAPTIIFTGTTPSHNTTGTVNNFKSQLQITENGIGLNQFRYTWNGQTYGVYDSGLVLMYNFDNVSALGENSTTVKDASQYANNGTVYNGATWTGNGKYIGAYVFNGSTNYIRTLSGLTTINGITVGAWINPKNPAYRTLLRIGDQVGTTGFHWLYLQNNITWQYTNGTNAISKSASYTFTPDVRYHILVSHDYTSKEIKYYVNGILAGTQTHVDTALPIANKQTTIGAYVSGDGPFSGLIDEVRIYNRVLTTGEIDLLYRSNLNKFSTSQRLFTDDRMCMVNGSYNYTGYASDGLSNNYSTGRKYNIAIPTYAGGTPWGINLGTVGAGGSAYTLSGQFTGYFQVQDDRGTTGWYTTIQLPGSLPGTTLSGTSNPSFSIATSNIEFRSNTGVANLIAGTSTTGVYISGGIINYSTFPGSKQYIMRDKSSNPYSCPTGTYGNMPWIKVNIPARQNPNTYSGTLTFDIVQ
ncbi:MAG: LamG domain-containing protein, partial [Candidatus Absconditicoccaceae bacterium]